MRAWRLADGTPLGQPLTGYTGAVAVAPDGSWLAAGGADGTVWVWRMTDGTPLVPPLNLSESVRAVAVRGNVIITAAGADIAVLQLALPQPTR